MAKNKRKTKIIALALTFLLSLSIALPSFASANKVSPALDIIATNLGLIKTGLVNTDIAFTAGDFDDALGIKKTQAVTIVSLPPLTSGKLMLGSLEVMRNQTISRKNLEMLRFVPSGAIPTECSFFFKNAGDSDYEMACKLYVLSELNFAPTVSMVNDSVLNIKTQQNITVYGTLKAHDPENDLLTFNITVFPKKGVLTLTDINYGNYKYTPVAGFKGRDSFKYVVTDKYGNTSDEIKVNIKVEKPASKVIYNDMLGHWAHNAAIKMTAADIMNGKQVGDEMRFDPTGAVTRCEFLVMAMKSLGFLQSVAVSDTGFADDDNIPTQYKGYVAAALQLEYINGIDENGLVSFYPNNQITRSEAAVMLNNMLDAKQPIIRFAFADQSNVPAWAEDAIYALSELGVLNGTGDGYFSPYATINRAQTAQILYSVMNLK